MKGGKMKTDKMIRMRLETYRRYRRVFPAESRNETLIHYFERLIKFLEDKWK